MRKFAEALKTLWPYRRWAYAAYILVCVIRIPARTGYKLNDPVCDMRLTVQNVALSMTKVPHIILFGGFFLLTVVQFNRLDRRAFTWSLIAILGMGALVEFEEGATRTGNCRMTDVLPDVIGALIVMATVMFALGIYSRFGKKDSVDFE